MVKHSPKGKAREVLPARRRLWTPAVKAMGNLIPALFSAPLAFYGIVWMSLHSQVYGLGFWIFAASPITGWLAMNFFGLYHNASMKHQLFVVLQGVRPRLHAPVYFVGIATPKYASILDPHEDIGFLILLPDRLEFFGDHMSLSIYRQDVLSIEYRPNVHTLVGLGRWVSVEGKIGDQEIRLQIEPREKRTLFGNYLFSRRLSRSLRAWAC